MSEEPVKQFNIVNAHPRDKNVSFDPDSHTYSIDGSSDGTTSVTTLLGDYFPKFDPDETIDKFYNRWQQNPLKKPECFGKTKEEIKEMWKAKGEEAAAEGTRLHAAIENFYDGKDTEYDQSRKEWQYFQNFQQKYKLVPFRTEMMLWSKDHKLGGMVDLVVQNEDGTFSLYDWKRSKDSISKTERSWGRTGSGPLRPLPDNHYYRYAVQLNLYRELLERYYGYRIASMHVVRFHPNARNFQLVDIDRFEKETNGLLKLREVEVNDSETTENLTDRLVGLAI